MRKGKACGQVAHAAARLAQMMTEEEWTEYLDYEVKIVYKVSAPVELARLGVRFSKQRHTIVFDSTWGMHTVFGMLSKDNPNENGEWKLA